MNPKRAPLLAVGIVMAIASVGRTPLAQTPHTTHPDAQWFPDAALGLFIHWDPAAVKGINNWSYVPQPFRANGLVLGELAQPRALGVNYLLGVGPMASGELEPEVYRNMSVVEDWMKRNVAAIKHAKPLADTETASVPATASGATRYLFVIPKFRDGGKIRQGPAGASR